MEKSLDHCEVWLILGGLARSFHGTALLFHSFSFCHSLCCAIICFFFFFSNWTWCKWRFTSVASHFMLLAILHLAIVLVLLKDANSKHSCGLFEAQQRIVKNTYRCSIFCFCSGDVTPGTLFLYIRVISSWSRVCVSSLLPDWLRVVSHWMLIESEEAT